MVRPYRTSDPKRAATALRAGKRVRLDASAAQIPALRAIFAAHYPPAVVAMLDIRASEAAERSGCIALRTTRKGTRVGLYRSLEAGIESDPAHPYTTVCEDHSTCVCYETRRDAESCLSHPEMWCDECREEDSAALVRRSSP